MNFSAWSIRSPIPSLLLFFILMVAGLVAFRGLPVQDFPDIELPVITVTAKLAGAAPAQLESEVTRKIEDAVASLGKIEHVSSTVTDGSSVTAITFALDKNMQEAADDVRDAVSRVRSTLPTDLEDPQISKLSISGGALLTYAVQSDAIDASDLSWLADDVLAKALLGARGVGQVTRQGGVDREVHVELDPVRLRAMGVTAADVSTRLRAIQQDTSGGRANIGQAEQALRAVGNVKSVAELSALELSLADGRQLRLSDVARVRDTVAEPRQLALLDGKPVLSLQVFRSLGTSEVSVAEAVRATVAQLQAAHPQVKITEINTTVTAVQAQYTASMHALYEGAALAVVVVWLFLRDRRATFVSAVALPLSIVPTFLAMNLLGFSLNTVTLLSLTLVVGVLVDDAIVEVENIDRHLRMGKSPLQAALEAADEIGMAVIATSLTLVAVFLPTAFMGGIPGRFFKQFGWTAAIAVLASLLVARLLTPMMSAYLLKPKPQAEPADGALMRRYLATVRWCLAHPFKTSGLAALFFVAAIALATRLPVAFLPTEDKGQITLTVTAAPGTLIGQTQALAEAVRTAALHEPEVAQVYTAIGTGSSGGMGGGGAASEVRIATLTLMLASGPRRSQQQVEAALRPRMAAIAGARIAIGGGESGEKLEVVLSGDDAEVLETTAQSLAREMRGLAGKEGFGLVSSSASLLRPEVVFEPDARRAADLGVTTQAIGQALRVATTGDFDASLAKLNLPTRQVPIRVQLDPTARTDLAALGQLPVTAKGGTVPLQQVARLTLDSGPAQIARRDRHRNVTIDMELAGRPLGDATRLVDQLPTLSKLPAGVSRSAAGDAERQAELFSGFGLAMLAGLFCVYAVMVLLFHDFLQPVTILAALPLAAGGAFGALYLCGFALSMPSLIGLLMLMGIVTKNSILLVEYAVTARRDRGLSRTEALLDACHKRARPIVMTTLAMIAGMLPMALGLEGDPSFRAPMAMAVIGGLLTSTVLSLVVVPVVFELVDEAGQRVRRWLSGRAPSGAVAVAGSAPSVVD